MILWVFSATANLRTGKEYLRTPNWSPQEGSRSLILLVSKTVPAEMEEIEEEKVFQLKKLLILSHEKCYGVSKVL